MSKNELLVIYDDDLNEIGVAPRSEVHERGLLHQVVHCWLIGRDQTGTWLYFQQRSPHTTFPGWYDIAASGHIDLDESPDRAVIRETQEELGVVIDPGKLAYLGVFRESFEFGSYLDHEIGQIYLYPVEECEFHLGDEVERMVKVSMDEFIRWLDLKTEPLHATVVGGGESVSICRTQVIPHERAYFEFVLTEIKRRRT